MCDFVCPTKNTRNNFNADLTIWMDTIEESRFDDTNSIFEKPSHVDFHITEWNDNNHIELTKKIIELINV